MQVSDIPDLGPEINDIRQRTARLVNDEIIPAEPLLGEREGPAASLAEVRRLQELVKAEGLWAPHLPPEYGGMGIGFLKHAYMNEVMGWSPYSSTIFGVQAPNSGNTMILLKHGIFTWSDDPREAYENMIAAIDRAEKRIAEGEAFPFGRFVAKAEPLASVSDIAPILRGALALPGQQEGRFRRFRCGRLRLRHPSDASKPGRHPAGAHANAAFALNFRGSARGPVALLVLFESAC